MPILAIVAGLMLWLAWGIIECMCYLVYFLFCVLAWGVRRALQSAS